MTINASFTGTCASMLQANLALTSDGEVLSGSVSGSSCGGSVPETGIAPQKKWTGPHRCPSTSSARAIEQDRPWLVMPAGLADLEGGRQRISRGRRPGGAAPPR